MNYCSFKVIDDYDVGEYDKEIVQIGGSYSIVNWQKLDYLDVFDQLSGLRC